MRVILAFLMVAASSCCSVLLVPELNTCGVVIREKDCKMEEGDKMYLVKITEKTYIEHPTYKRYRVGDTICFKSTIINYK